MHEAQDKQTVGAGGDAHPIVRHSVIARTDWIDANHPRAALFQLAQAHLDGVAVVILGYAEQHEQLGTIPIGLAKFPERAAHRIDACGGHVHRTKTTVGGVVRCAKALGPHGGKALRLVAARKERELGWIVPADRLQP